jgi:hypothetical protein
MALTQATRIGATALHALAVDAANANVFQQSEKRRYGSEVEVVDGLGKLVDIIYSGEEITVTETKIGTALDAVDGQGDLNTGIITRSSLKFSNEDVSKVETEKLKIPL